MAPWTNPALTGLTCARSGTSAPADVDRRRRCRCCDPGQPLLFHYDLEALTSDPPGIPSDPGGHGIWRFAPLLPVHGVDVAFASDVGATPIARHERLGSALDVELWIKNETTLPGGCDAARGFAVAAALACADGVERFCVAATGADGVAAACMAARLEAACAVYLPAREEQGPHAVAARHFGAEVRCVGADLDACAEAMREDLGAELESGERVDLRVESGRVEGLKTLGLELVADLGAADLPEAIVYPTGDGAALVGIWKAFEELRALGVLEAAAPRLYAVQSERCQPVVRAYAQGLGKVLPVRSKGTVAAGLDVPSTALGHAVLRAMRQSGGGAVAVSDASIEEAFAALGRAGVDAGREGAAGYAGLSELLDRGDLDPGVRALVWLPR